MHTIVKYLVLGVIAVVIGGLIYISLTSKNQLLLGTLFEPKNKQVTDRGNEIYSTHCAICHGSNLEGQTKDWQTPNEDGKLPAPPHDETGHTWHHSDQLLFNITKYGTAKAANLIGYRSAMPAYEGILSDEDIIAVLSFIKSTWPKNLQEAHDRLNAAVHE